MLTLFRARTRRPVAVLLGGPYFAERDYPSSNGPVCALLSSPARWRTNHDERRASLRADLATVGGRCHG